MATWRSTNRFSARPTRRFNERGRRLEGASVTKPQWPVDSVIGWEIDICAGRNFRALAIAREQATNVCSATIDRATECNANACDKLIEWHTGQHKYTDDHSCTKFIDGLNMYWNVPILRAGRNMEVTIFRIEIEGKLRYWTGFGVAWGKGLWNSSALQCRDLVIDPAFKSQYYTLLPERSLKNNEFVFLFSPRSYGLRRPLITFPDFPVAITESQCSSVKWFWINPEATFEWFDIGKLVVDDKDVDNGICRSFIPPATHRSACEKLVFSRSLAANCRNVPGVGDSPLQYWNVWILRANRNMLQIILENCTYRSGDVTYGHE